MKPYRMQRRARRLRPGPLGRLGVPGAGARAVADRARRGRAGGQLLENVVDVEIDYATRHRLPGFLSESYSGEGVQYTGSVGIPEITVSPRPRITDAASLYTLGAAYSVAPDKVERFLAANWPVVSRLLTDHGPWEGYNVTRKEVIRFQTTAHTLAADPRPARDGIGSYEEPTWIPRASARGSTRSSGPATRSTCSPTQTRVFAWNDKDSPDPVQARESRLSRAGPKGWARPGSRSCRTPPRE